MKWKLQPSPDTKLSKEFKDYPEFFIKVLSARGIKTQQQLDDFAYKEQDYYDPFLLSDMDKAVERIKMAIKNKEKVFIYGDYDVDGVTATSLLWDFLYRELELDTLPYIPSRFDEGYGMSEAGLDRILEEGGQLIITVDCGIRDIDLVKKYREKGLDFIITDHHTLPTDKKGKPKVSEDAVAVIHPSHPESKYPFKDICGASVAWKFVCALSKIIKSDFDPEKYVDLVSLATVTDIMPLIDENRLILKRGLIKIKNTENIGLRNLMIESKIDPEDIQVYHYGFVIGPRLNAAGRIAHALDGVRLLTTESSTQAAKYAKRLTSLNIERQGLTQTLLEQSMEMVEDKESHVHVIFGEGWSEGVVGLVAGKLQEKYYRPVFVGTKDGDLITGSARSISGFNVTEALEAADHLLERYGGHAQAAGFTVHTDNAEDLKQHLLSYANENIDPSQLIRVLEIDAELKDNDITLESCDLIELLKPFGYKNKKPVFVIKDCKILSIKFIGRENNHIKLSLMKDTARFEVIGFNKAEEFKSYNVNDIIDVAGNLEKNVWNGNVSVQFKLIDQK